MAGEVLAGLQVVTDGIYIDGTYGRGGHAALLLARLGSRGRLFAIDKDLDAVEAARRQHSSDSRFEITHGSFSEMMTIAANWGVAGNVDGLMLDLGVSSPQLDVAARGFSFMQDGPLDMRMDTSSGVTAGAWLAEAEEREIADVLYHYGEERRSRQIARRIVAYRTDHRLESTVQLAELISSVVGGRREKKHPATRSFQAIRIFINRELEDLETGLEQGLKLIKAGGRLAVISFHSLEDRIVKRFMRNNSRINAPRKLPPPDAQMQPPLKLVGKAQKPTTEEIAGNPRARSAVLRVAEKRVLR